MIYPFLILFIHFFAPSKEHLQHLWRTYSVLGILHMKSVLFLTHPCEIVTINSILQLRKQRPREMKKNN